MSCSNSSKAPVAKRRPVKLKRHGISDIDYYQWLRAPNWRSAIRDPGLLPDEISNYLEEENNWFKDTLASGEKIRRKIVMELSERLESKYESAPRVDGKYTYLECYNKGAEYAQFIRRKPGISNSTEILLDAEIESTKHQFYNVSSTSHSPDHRYFSWTADTTGTEEYRISIIDTKSRVLLNEIISKTQGPIIWTSRGKSFFYTKIDSHQRPSSIYEHKLGNNPKNDRLVYNEINPEYFVSIQQSEDNNYAIIVIRGHNLTSESRILNLNIPDAKPILIYPKKVGHDYEISIYKDNLFIRTNYGEAIDYKIVSLKLNDFTKEKWIEIVSHKKGRVIEKLMTFKGYLVWIERNDGLARIVVKDLNNGKEHNISFLKEKTYDLQLSRNSQFDNNILRYTFSSLKKPAQTIDHGLDTQKKEIVKQQIVPSGHNPENYTVERIFARASDGSQIPISLITKKGGGRDNPKPLILYGYGSYGTIIPANFSTDRLSLIDRGFTWAIAHVRGGADLGLSWYLNGKLEYKKNTFSDFISCAEYLCSAGYTKPGMIGILGRSAGGMLIGAAINLRPDLFKSAVAEVPFVDVLNTMCDETLPLTPPEWTEWGNPIENPRAFQAIKEYSPYDNIEKCNFPHILATSGVSDPRVTYWEAAKWIAKLRANNTGSSDIILNTNMSAGHGGSSGRYKRLEETALTYTFFLKSFAMLKKE